MKISIIIPVYNEEKTLKKVISNTQKVFASSGYDYEIILVDDGSKDKTGEIMQQNSDPHILSIQHEKNYGKGRAIQNGVKKATGEYIAIQDADLEYDPANLCTLSKKAIEEKSVVYGKRDGRSGYILNRLGNKVLSLVCNMLFFSKLSDIYTCYKVAPRELMQSLRLSSDGFEIEAEITAKILKKKIKIIEIPITYSPRSFQEGKHIRWRDGYRGILKLIEIKLERSTWRLDRQVEK